MAEHGDNELAETHAARNYKASYLTRVYINNEPYLMDTESQQVCPETERGDWQPASDFVDNRKFHFASYPMVKLNGVAYFHEEERKLFRRVGSPFDFKSYRECEGIAIGAVKPDEAVAIVREQNPLGLRELAGKERTPRR